MNINLLLFPKSFVRQKESFCNADVVLVPVSMLMGRCQSNISKWPRITHACIRNLKWLPNIDAQQDCLSQDRCSLLEVFYKKDVLKNFTKFRSRNRRCSVRKGVLRKLANFTGKHLCQSLFLNKVVGKIL